MSDPTIILGIGSTKSGTSWLYESLAMHPQVHLRTIKELHWFDTRDAKQTESSIKRLEADIEKMTLRLLKAPESRTASLKERIADRQAFVDVLRDGSQDAYLTYLRDRAGPALAVGDVTPAYSIQPETVLRRMATMASDVRAIYLMRDPVDRLWSHVRMIARRRGDGKTVEADRARRILNRVFTGKETEIVVRGDYAAALDRIEASFAPDKRWIGTFEAARTPEGWTSICQFLGLDVHPAKANVVHGGAPAEMTQDDQQRAQEWLAPQYEAVARRMVLPQTWTQHDTQARA